MVQNLHRVVAQVTARIEARSQGDRAAYLDKLAAMRAQGRSRGRLSCTNLAHGFAASGADQSELAALQWPNLAIVSAYNDMLSAHQPLGRFPGLIKLAAREVKATAQFAGGVPAMCDGVTQGQPGMELSLLSRDVIAMSTAIALSHDMFDATLALGVCDKIVPGLLMGALSFGHLPSLFVPAGPMTSGLPNDEKARIRQLYAEGKLGRDDLLKAEMQAYHGPGTCTFYGTANSNQMLMEVMGLHLPGAAFVNPNTPLRDALTAEAARQAGRLARQSAPGVGEMIDARSIVNAIVGLLATGGSTNHTLHIIAIARCAGWIVNWDDFAELSAVVPLLARIYPNGSADVNHFHAAGGMGFLIRELLQGGLLHAQVRTVAGGDLSLYTREPRLADDGGVRWQDAPLESGDEEVLRPLSRPFAPTGGLQLLTGNLGRAVIKVSAVKPQHRLIEAPAMVFDSQEELLTAFKDGRMERDLVAVVRGQGPRANGMPELHKLTPQLGILQDRGFQVALVTDGRMSGASGKVPAAIHVTPEVSQGGALGKLRDGDLIRLDAEAGTLSALVQEDLWAGREVAAVAPSSAGYGREMFGHLRQANNGAEAGAASVF
ncbi:phosphogluconate dehydratase [Oceanococcus atlanticus]|uniref:Phosphogluconate dehydratase n=1 Tax=Oceanococcus atlanticus TaxID=1317117 RepID=A0A1Y1SD23_9GAMM|nr:phosphogluconate dehydratase [Oceanococcus atlanticus]